MAPTASAPELPRPTIQTSASSPMPVLAALPSPKQFTSGAATPTESTALHSDSVSLDVSRLMEVVRQEVTALMLDGIQKTASFCASQCAKHVVAARREMHQRLTEQKYELDRLQGGQSRVCSSLTPSCVASPGSTAFSTLTPRKAPPLPGAPLPKMSLTPRSATPGGIDTSSRIRLTPRATPRVSSADEISCSTYDTYIGVHDAVQTLEERTQMAMNAMEAIEEAINVSMGAVPASPSAGVPDQSAPGTPCSTFTWPRGEPLGHSSSGAPRGNASANGTITPTRASTPQRMLTPPVLAGQSRQPQATSCSTTPVSQPSGLPSGGAFPTMVAGRSGTGDQQVESNDLAPRRARIEPTSVDAGRDRERGSRSSEAKFRAQSIESAFSEAESIAPAMLQGY